MPTAPPTACYGTDVHLESYPVPLLSEPRQCTDYTLDSNETSWVTTTETKIAWPSRNSIDEVDNIHANQIFICLQVTSELLNQALNFNEREYRFAVLGVFRNSESEPKVALKFND